MKWLVIAAIVVVGFIIVLLGLGFLLNENERDTYALKRQLEQKNDKATPAEMKTKLLDVVIVEKPITTELTAQQQKQQQQLFQQIVLNNLSCEQQSCQLITVDFANTRCTLAINKLGGSLLAKFDTKALVLPTCSDDTAQYQAQCIANQCQLVKP